MSQAALSPASSSLASGAGSPQTAAVEVLLVTGSSGMAIAGFDAAGTVVYTGMQPAAGTPGQLFENPLSGSAVRRSLLLCDARQLVIPEALYQDGEVQAYFRSCFYLSPEEDLVVTRVSGAPYRVATPCPLSLATALKAQQPTPQMLALGAAVLHSPPAQPHFARVLLAPGASYLALWREGQLLEATATETAGEYDLAYLLLALAHQNGIAPEALTVQVESLLETDEAAEQLEAFIAEERLVHPDPAYPDRRTATFARIRSCVS